MAQQISKKQSTGRFTNFKNKHITHPKLLLVLLILLALPLSSFAHNKYKDWDNAQMIKGIAKDFPLLVEEIEKATGLDLEIKKNCMTTSEKFGSGVKTCEVRVAKATEQKHIDKSVEIVTGSSSFSVIQHNQQSNAYKIGYRSKSSCTLSGSDTIYFSCIIGVRDANTQLALDLL